jgi:hypothetical protein
LSSFFRDEKIKWAVIDQVVKDRKSLSVVSRLNNNIPQPFIVRWIKEANLELPESAKAGSLSQGR